LVLDCKSHPIYVGLNFHALINMLQIDLKKAKIQYMFSPIVFLCRLLDWWVWPRCNEAAPFGWAYPHDDSCIRVAEEPMYSFKEIELLSWLKSMLGLMHFAWCKPACLVFWAWVDYFSIITAYVHGWYTWAEMLPSTVRYIIGFSPYFWWIDMII
jgi:hypothetical protein